MPFDIRESVSNVKSHGEGAIMTWFLEDCASLSHMCVTNSAILVTLGDVTEVAQPVLR
jgi:hypothetical protein